ncbi:MAG: hypothetical protein IJF74_00255 [Clostridia bacterium]|nr:hypothetical protein [Clostridia bacterium]MBQ7011751.1 hypothetical protein [Clostridia bacterium]
MITVDLSTANNSRAMLIDAEFNIASVKADGGGLIKFIHGVGRGSSVRRRSLRSHLRNAVRRGSVKQMLEGERFSSEDRLSRYFCNFHPELNDDPDINGKNANITFVRI